jgi:histidine triad (HIT) family protein
MADPDCLFCKIVAGEIPSHTVDEDDRTIAVMDINPWTRGHALVIPKEHSRNIYDIAQDDLAAASSAAQRLARQMRDRLSCEGINVVQSSEPAAMQTVFHYHLHVIPRYSDDGLKLAPHPQAAEHEELAALAEELRAHG